VDVDPKAWHAAAEQLYDELMARTWSVHQVVGSALTDVDRRDVSHQLVVAAQRTIAGLQGPDSDQVADGLRRLLWPCGALPGPGDPWWATPLGQLLAIECATRSPSGRLAAGSPVN